MTMPKLYKFRLKHDSGFVTIQTSADTLAEAIQRICDLEKCPVTAIKQAWKISWTDDSAIQLLNRA